VSFWEGLIANEELTSKDSKAALPGLWISAKPTPSLVATGASFASNSGALFLRTHAMEDPFASADVKPSFVETTSVVSTDAELPIPGAVDLGAGGCGRRFPRGVDGGGATTRGCCIVRAGDGTRAI